MNQIIKTEAEDEEQNLNTKRLNKKKINILKNYSYLIKWNKIKGSIRMYIKEI